MPNPPSRTLSSRYIDARVIKVFPDGGLEAEPRSPATTGASRIKVHRYHLPADRLPPNKPYQLDDTVRLFVYNDQRAARDPGKAAYASAIWAMPANNPWENERAMEVGGIVTGSVVRFPDDQHAIVLLDELVVDAWLNAKDVPEASPYYRYDDEAPLANFLSLNDRIKARLQRIDRENCRIDISIVDAFEEWKIECKQNAQNQTVPPAGYERLHLDELADHEEQIFLWQPISDSLSAESPTPTATAVDDASSVAGLPIWREVRLLVIENDTAFAKSLGAWVSSQGGTAQISSGHESLQGLLKNGKIDHLQWTHVLCDFNLSSHSDSKACHAWVERHLGPRTDRSAVHVAWMSAQPEAVRQAQTQTPGAKGAGGTRPDDGRLTPYLAKLPLFAKPILFRDLHAWLTKGQAPRRNDLADDERHRIWNAKRPDESVLERGRAALAQFCAAGKALAALWIDAPEEALSENEYDDARLDLQVRAWHGSLRPPENWHVKLGQSLLRDVFYTRAFAGQRATASGPLREVAPPSAEWVVAWPIVSLVTGASDSESSLSNSLPQGALLAFFDRDALTHLVPAWEPEGALGRLAALTCRHLDDLGALLSVSEHAREQDLFASSGRQLAAVLHELRSLSGDLVALTDERPMEHSPAAQPPSLPRSRRKALRKLLKVAQQGLFYVKKERLEQLGLAGMLQRMTADLLWLPILHSGCSLHVLLPEKRLQVTIPVEPLEHALGNIIGNAVDWSRGRPYARVSVSVELRSELGDMPLCIRVSDQGLGVGRDAERNLLSPRLTEKGRKGQGMGLYISRTLLRGIGGDLVFDRKKNFRFFGATFEIRGRWWLGERRQDAARPAGSGSQHVR
ncbi:MAG: hypothetical protein JNL84_00040 [Candidatus Accumulibacter sp.]|nr:hypothetical protein [Accumulibacter sp.]